MVEMGCVEQFILKFEASSQKAFILEVTMKKVFGITLLMATLFVGCASSHIVLYNDGEQIYEGYGKATPDFTNPTFNIKVKEEGGDVILFFGNKLSGSIEE